LSLNFKECSIFNGKKKYRLYHLYEQNKINQGVVKSVQKLKKENKIKYKIARKSKEKEKKREPNSSRTSFNQTKCQR
jgi:uncharacterized HAD superfamily protein